MPVLKKTMFREYDIRGKEAEDELNEQSMYLLGKGFGTYLKNKGINDCIVGYDARSTSESFHHQVIKGLRESGVNVIDIGMGTTPYGYWAQHFLKIKGLAMVTASHNPSGWNGLKVCQDLSRNLFGEEVQQIHELIEKEQFTQEEGTLSEKNVTQEYKHDLLSKVNIVKKFKILVNTGNGTAGIIAPKMIAATGCEVIEHNTNIDPTYPNYTPNPDNIKMMEDTAAQVLKNNCDFGLAFDGDADRLGLVDEKGTIVSPDKILILLARLVLSKHPGVKIMGDVKVSEAFVDDVKAHGGEAILWRTGHSLIKNKMGQEDIALAGEMSGHMFFKEGFYGFDDGIFSALKLLEYLSSQNIPVSQIIASIPKYITTPMITLETTDEVKHNIVKEIVSELEGEGYKVLNVDGARFYTEDGWGLIRASNTTPIIVLRFESKTNEGIEKLKNIIKEKLKKYPEVSTNWNESGH